MSDIKPVAYVVCSAISYSGNLYSADALTAARDAALEEVIALVGRRLTEAKAWHANEKNLFTEGYMDATLDCADAIRTMKGKRDA